MSTAVDLLKTTALDSGKSGQDAFNASKAVTNGGLGSTPPAGGNQPGNAGNTGTLLYNSQGQGQRVNLNPGDLANYQAAGWSTDIPGSAATNPGLTKSEQSLAGAAVKTPTDNTIPPANTGVDANGNPTDFTGAINNINNVKVDPAIAAANANAAAASKAEMDRLTAVKTASLAALDTQHASDLAALQTQNDDQLAATKARMIKLGISPSDSSFDNAVAGQTTRNQAALNTLNSEYQSNVAKINADMEEKISTVAMNQIQNDVKAATDEANNLLQKQGLAKDIATIFSSRDQSEKDREVAAYNDLLTYNTKMAELDQSKQQAIAKSFMDNAQAGMYNMSDPNTVKLLQTMEKAYPQYLTGVTGVATSGLKDRLLANAEKSASIAEKGASIAHLNAQTQSVIANTAAITEPAKVSSYVTQLGSFLMPDGKPNSSYFGPDGKMDSSKYNLEMTKFVSQFDPKLKNEKYYKEIFYTQFPPDKLLNSDANDPTAANIRKDYDATLKTPATNVFGGDTSQ